MIYHDIPWCYRVLQGKVCIIPVSKHHGILPWFPCFETPWYFTMVSLFPNTMVFYHGFPVSKHHGILPWFICTGTLTRTRTHAHMQTHMHAHIITLHTHSRRNERKHARTHARTHALFTDACCEGKQPIKVVCLIEIHSCGNNRCLSQLLEGQKP